VNWLCRLCRAELPPLSFPKQVPSKKYAGATLRRLASCCKRLALILFVPFSYFWTCWKLILTASPTWVWLRPKMSLRVRSRAAEIVAAFVSKNAVPSSELAALFETVPAALTRLSGGKSGCSGRHRGSSAGGVDP
jgi:hypothetical protein